MTKEKLLDYIHNLAEKYDADDCLEDTVIYLKGEIGIIQSMVEQLEERPKGEWKLRHLNQGYEVYCTNCGKGKGFMWDKNFLEDYKRHPSHSYCNNCGADMRESYEMKVSEVEE